ncbi:hypothetical protein EV363DRAFT_1523694 [Boletus edulis]|nr:hypothetical protein EV363DRAFT_1523694 [Boletus edulis]
MSQPWPVQLDSTSDPDRASLSPRTDLLSPSPEFDDVDPRRIPRGPGVKFRRERERAHSTASPRDLMDMLVNEEYESKQTRKVLYTAFDRLEHETRRAEGAEARIEETIQRARAINEARISAEQRTVRAQEELKLYKLQLDNAQKEILRAQEVLKAIEAQRDEAEAAAVSARSRARRLNEERMIELAREEGRRLGFEEGVRRGRRMDYRAYATGIDDRREQVREVAADMVDRLLEAPDEPEQIEVLQGPTPIPPPSVPRTPPEVHRIETPINSFFGHRQQGEPEAQSSRPRLVSQPWGGPPTDPPFSRPTSVRNSSPHRSEIHVLPDNYIPTADANHHISLPPPHELHRIPSPSSSQQTLGQAPERGKGRDYMYDNYPPPRRGSPDDSLASGKQSTASTISQLDIVGLPPSARHRDRSHGGLSVIHEDASNRSDRMSDYSQTVASTPQAGRDAFAGMRSSESLQRDRKAKQRFADELRYSDPSQAEQWRQQSDSRSQQPREGPSTRHLPSHVTVPTPLSPPRVQQQPDARLRRSTSERQGRPKTRSGPRDQRRPLSSDSSVPEINVEPPSRSPSDAPSRGLGNPPPNGLLSPDHAHRPLPVPAPSGTSGRSSPVYAIPSNGQVPPGFVPSRSPTVNGPSHGPVIPQNTGGGAPPQHHAGLYRSSSERSETGRSTPIAFYAASPVPAGVTYPAPPISRSTTYHAHPYSQSAGSNLSVTSEGRRRRDSLGATAGMTPASRTRPIQTTGSADSGGHDSRMSRRQSNASLGSQRSRPPYSRYDPTEYHDIAYLVRNDSVDSVTSANTAANGGGPVRIHGSPAYMYSTLRTNE